jgi:hypothetical protein
MSTQHSVLRQLEESGMHLVDLVQRAAAQWAQRWVAHNNNNSSNSINNSSSSNNNWGNSSAGR